MTFYADSGSSIRDSWRTTMTMPESVTSDRHNCTASMRQDESFLTLGTGGGSESLGHR